MTSNIQSLAEQITREVDNLVTLEEKTNQTAKQLAEFDQKLRKQEIEINKKKADYQNDLKFLEEKEKQISEKVQKVQESEIIREKIIKLIDEKKNLEIDLKFKEQNLLEKEQKLDEKIKNLEYLNNKEKDLEKRNALLQKETLLDRERKSGLDIREKKINDEASRLQRIADSFK